MSLARIDNWPKHLAAFLHSRRSLPFAWGSNDCGIFAADAILEITGVDLADGIRGTYSDEAGAKQALAKATNGGGLLEFVEQAAAAHGLKEIPVLFGQRGDLAVYPHPLLGNTAVIVGLEGHKVWGPGETRAAHYPRAGCTRTWRVG